MEDKVIQEGNKLIAEFIGNEKRENVFEGRPVDYKVDGWWTIPEKMKYHTSWDWLMPVVEKIGDIAADTYGIAEGKKIYEQCGIVMSTQVCVGIEGLWDRIIQFIKWYNKQKQGNDKPHR